MVPPLLVAAGRLPRGWRRGRSSRSGQRLVRSVRSAAPHAVRAAATTEAGARQDMVLLARRHAHHQTPREETQLRCSAWVRARVECRRSPRHTEDGAYGGSDRFLKLRLGADAKSQQSKSAQRTIRAAWFLPRRGGVYGRHSGRCMHGTVTRRMSTMFESHTVAPSLRWPEVKLGDRQALPRALQARRKHKCAHFRSLAA